MTDPVRADYLACMPTSPASLTVSYRRFIDSVTGTLYLDLWLGGNDLPTIGGTSRPAFFVVSSDGGFPTVPVTVDAVADYTPGGYLQFTSSLYYAGEDVAVTPTLWPDSATFQRLVSAVNGTTVTLANAVPSPAAYVDGGATATTFTSASTPYRTDAVRIPVPSATVGSNLLSYYSGRLTSLVNDINNTLGWVTGIEVEVINGN